MDAKPILDSTSPGNTLAGGDTEQAAGQGEVKELVLGGLSHESCGDVISLVMSVDYPYKNPTEITSDLLPTDDPPGLRSAVFRRYSPVFSNVVCWNIHPLWMIFPAVNLHLLWGFPLPRWITER